MAPGFLKRFFIGKPLRSGDFAEERLDKRTALAVFSSDALSSVAYATEEILLVLVLAGTAALTLSVPVALGIGVLLTIVVLSYGQTIKAYPTGGGAYIVAKENLGDMAGLIAGAALLLDYTLTVAVSVTAGTAAITSAFPALQSERVPIALAAIALVTVVNLRGLRASGKAFSMPAYLFVLTVGALIVAGIWRHFAGLPPVIAPGTAPAAQGVLEALTPYLVLRAFASGCTALTGIEAISDGVQAFKRPEAKNARHTLFAMGAILVSFFLGITWLARAYGIVPMHDQTVLSQIARAVFGGGFPYYLVQTATALVLLFAANTAFADFPRLCFFMARDRFLPVQLVNRGDRLVYSNGILALAACSAALVFGFSADTHRLIPLYAVGVFIGFTLSQTGMIRKWYEDRTDGWRMNMTMNAVGAIATAAVLVVIATSKFRHGAWAVFITIPAMVAFMYAIKRHYRHLKTSLTLTEEKAAPIPTEHVVILFIGDIHKGTVAAMRYAKSLNPTKLKAIHISIDENDAGELREKWKRWGMDIPLIITPSPYRRVTEILLHYVRELERQHPQAIISVILPEFVCPKWWQWLLHNRTATWLKRELHKEHVAVVSVPIQLV